MAPKKNKRSSRRGCKPKALPSIANGGRFAIPADPPSTIRAPWNSVVLVLDTTGTVTVTTLVTALRTQLWLPATVYPSIRVQSVKVWSKPVDPEKGVGLVAYNLEAAGTTNAVPLFDGQDAGTNMNRARLAYRWPQAQQKLAFSAASAEPVFGWSSPGIANGQGSWRAHVRLMWRPNASVDGYKPPAPTVDPDELARTLSLLWGDVPEELDNE